MQSISPGQWVSHDGYPGIWQVAETKTKGGTVYAVLHNHHKALKEGGFEAITAAPATIEAAADVLTVADKHKRKTTREQPFADQEDTIKLGPFWVKSPAIPDEMSPIIFLSHVGSMLNEGTDEIILTELFAPKTNGFTKDQPPFKISLSNSVLTPVPHKSANALAKIQIEKALGKEEAEKLILRSDFERSNLADLLSLARTIDRIDGLQFSPRSIEEARSLLYMLDDGQLLWDKLMLLFWDLPNEGILWYERLQRLIGALPETNGKIPLFARQKYDAVVKQHGEGWQNLSDAQTPDLAQKIGTPSAKKLVRRDAPTGLPLYYLWHPEDEVYYLFMPSNPSDDLGSRTVAETKADFLSTTPTPDQLQAQARLLARLIAKTPTEAQPPLLAQQRLLKRLIDKVK